MHLYLWKKELAPVSSPWGYLMLHILTYKNCSEIVSGNRAIRNYIVFVKIHVLQREWHLYCCNKEFTCPSFFLVSSYAPFTNILVLQPCHIRETWLSVTVNLEGPSLANLFSVTKAIFLFLCSGVTLCII